MTTIFSFEFGKAARVPGTPKNAPRWVFRCTCGCGKVVGPFKTLKQAQAAAEQSVVDYVRLRRFRTLKDAQAAVEQIGGRLIDESAGSTVH